MVEVKEPEPDIIDVLLPSSQKLLKNVLTANNGSSRCSKCQMLSDKEKKEEDRKHQQKIG
jgi:hypothetical protein